MASLSLLGSQSAAFSSMKQFAPVSPPGAYCTQDKLRVTTTFRAFDSPIPSFGSLHSGHARFMTTSSMRARRWLNLVPLPLMGELRAAMPSAVSKARTGNSSRVLLVGSLFLGVNGSIRNVRLKLRCAHEERRAKGKTARLAARGANQYDGSKPFIPSETEKMCHLNDDVGAENVQHDDKRGSALAALSPAAVSSPAYENAGNKSVRVSQKIEEGIERTIFNFRFLTLCGVVGSLLGAVLCFLKGCVFVAYSYREYYRAFFGVGHTERVLLYLVEAVDVYLMGTVMLIFGMGLYELFVSSLEVGSGPDSSNAPDGVFRSPVCDSNLFGLFRLRERPKWLEIRSLDELKSKLGHVIVMILFVGLFEKSKRVVVRTSTDFLCFSGSVLLSAGALFLLSMLHSNSSHINNSQQSSK